MSIEQSVFCEHIRVGDKPLFHDEPLEDNAEVETTPAFRCGLADQACKYATRKEACPTYQQWLAAKK